MVLVTNSVFFVLCSIYFKRLKTYDHAYAKQMSWFIYMLGFSSVFGAIGHTVQYQLGDVFFKSVVFVMNSLSLFAIYFCFRSAYTYFNLEAQPSKKYIYFVMFWVLILLIYSGVRGNFLIIKIHAGIVLLYSLVVHFLVYKRTGEKGGSIVVWGIVVSFIPIFVHSLRFSISEWFNYKDISHVLMIFSLIVIFKGAQMISEKLKVVYV